MGVGKIDCPHDELLGEPSLGAESYSVIETCRSFFVERGIGKIDYPHEELLADPNLGLEHCHGMIDKMVEFVREGRFEKTFRWLGFIQGVLWSNEVFNLDHPNLGLKHCHGMLDKIVEFVQEGRMEKAFHYLGFIQGVLWSNRVYTLEDLKNQNRPDQAK